MITKVLRSFNNNVQTLNIWRSEHYIYKELVYDERDSIRLTVLTCNRRNVLDVYLKLGVIC